MQRLGQRQQPELASFNRFGPCQGIAYSNGMSTSGSVQAQQQQQQQSYIAKDMPHQCTALSQPPLIRSRSEPYRNACSSDLQMRIDMGTLHESSQPTQRQQFREQQLGLEHHQGRRQQFGYCHPETNNKENEHSRSSQRNQCQHYQSQTMQIPQLRNQSFPQHAHNPQKKRQNQQQPPQKQSFHNYSLRSVEGSTGYSSPTPLFVPSNSPQQDISDQRYHQPGNQQHFIHGQVMPENELRSRPPNPEQYYHQHHHQFQTDQRQLNHLQSVRQEGYQHQQNQQHQKHNLSRFGQHCGSGGQSYHQHSSTERVGICQMNGSLTEDIAEPNMSATVTPSMGMACDTSLGYYPMPSACDTHPRILKADPGTESDTGVGVHGTVYYSANGRVVSTDCGSGYPNNSNCASAIIAGHTSRDEAAALAPTAAISILPTERSEHDGYNQWRTPSGLVLRTRAGQKVELYSGIHQGCLNGPPAQDYLAVAEEEEEYPHQQLNNGASGTSGASGISGASGGKSERGLIVSDATSTSTSTSSSSAAAAAAATPRRTVANNDADPGRCTWADQAIKQMLEAANMSTGAFSAASGSVASGNHNHHQQRLQLNQWGEKQKQCGVMAEFQQHFMPQQPFQVNKP